MQKCAMHIYISKCYRIDNDVSGLNSSNIPVDRDPVIRQCYFLSFQYKILVCIFSSHIMTPKPVQEQVMNALYSIRVRNPKYE